MYMKWQNYSHTNSQILLQNKPFIIKNKQKRKLQGYKVFVEFWWIYNEIKLDSYAILVSV